MQMKCKWLESWSSEVDRVRSTEFNREVRGTHGSVTSTHQRRDGQLVSRFVTARTIGTLADTRWALGRRLHLRREIGKLLVAFTIVSSIVGLIEIQTSIIVEFVHDIVVLLERRILSKLVRVMTGLRMGLECIQEAKILDGVQSVDHQGGQRGEVAPHEVPPGSSTTEQGLDPGGCILAHNSSKESVFHESASAQVIASYRSASMMKVRGFVRLHVSLELVVHPKRLSSLFLRDEDSMECLSLFRYALHVVRVNSTEMDKRNERAVVR